jgi:hypothetical protein
VKLTVAALVRRLAEHRIGFGQLHISATHPCPI